MACFRCFCITLYSIFLQCKPIRSVMQHTMHIFGIAYYLLMACLYTALLLSPAFFAMPWLKMAMAALSFGGVLLSIYFLMLQAFVIRAWCSWCVASALASFLLGISAWHLAGGLVRTFISHTFLPLNIQFYNLQIYK